MIKLILIDFDDTLVMTEQACFLLENEIGQALGMAPMTRHTHQLNWGKPMAQAIAERLPGIDVDAFLDLHRQTLLDHVNQGKIDQVDHQHLVTLQQLKSQGYQLGILTSRTLNEVQHLVAQGHQLSQIIDVFYHADNLEVTKPNPTVFDKPLANFNLQPHQVVYIGDSPTDATAAIGAGLHFIASLQSGLRTAQDFADFPQTHFAQTFTDIPDIISRL